MHKDSHPPRFKAVRMRRTYSPQLKAQLVALSRQSGVSIAALALQHGINSNVLHRWPKRWRRGLNRLVSEQAAVATSTAGPAFVAVPLPPPSPVQAGTQLRGHGLTLQLQRGELVASVQANVSDCAALLREVLR